MGVRLVVVVTWAKGGSTAQFPAFSQIVGEKLLGGFLLHLEAG